MFDLDFLRLCLPRDAVSGTGFEVIVTFGSVPSSDHKGEIPL